MVSKNSYVGFDRYADQLIRHKARQLIGKAGWTDDDRPDLEQELALDLVQRMRSYDPQKAKVTTFMTRVVEHRMVTLLEARFAQCRDWRRGRVSLNAPVNDRDDAEELIDTLSSDPEAWQKMELCMDVEQLIASLPNEQRFLCEQLKDNTMAEAARNLGLPRSTLYGRLDLIRKRFVAAELVNA